MVFCFVQNFFFRTTQVLEYLFFCCAKREIFFQNLTLCYDNNSESDYFFFLHQNQNIFFSNIGNQNIFLEKKHNPPPPPFKLNGRSLRYVDIVNAELIESTLKQTIMHSCFNDFLWLSKYEKCCVHLIFIDCFIWLMFILRKI